jgi:hypothetical protein
MKPAVKPAATGKEGKYFWLRFLVPIISLLFPSIFQSKTPVLKVLVSFSVFQTLALKFSDPKIRVFNPAVRVFNSVF